MIVKSRIHTGFALVLALLRGVAIFGVTGLGSADDAMEQYGKISDTAVRVNVLAFATSGDKSSVDAARTMFAAIRKALPAAIIDKTNQQPQCE